MESAAKRSTSFVGVAAIVASYDTQPADPYDCAVRTALEHFVFDKQVVRREWQAPSRISSTKLYRTAHMPA